MIQWQNPAGAWAFLALLPVIAFYMLKRRARQQPVPSLFLWRLTGEKTDANRPFQKLKNQLLLWLQLLLAALLAVALMRPAAMGGGVGETALVIDLSASMQTVENGGTRLDAAKDAARAWVEQMGEADGVTLITAGAAIGQAAVRSTDHAAVVRLIDGLKAENGGGDVEGAVALAMAMGREIPGLSIRVFSDRYVSPSEGIAVQAIGHAMPNRCIRSLRLSQTENGMTAFAQVWNWGEAVEAVLECYADGALCDLRTVSLVKDGGVSVQFSLPEGTRTAQTRFSQPDALPGDDGRWAVAPTQTQYRALLVGDGNVFLEKALALRDDLLLTRATLSDSAEAQGYDLYVYDGGLPETLPETGAVLAIHPDAPLLGLTPGEAQAPSGTLRAGASEIAQELCRHMLLSDVAVKTCRPLSGGVSVLTMGGTTVLAVDGGQRRAAALGFDLHDSNLPLKADFPMMVQNLLDYLLPEVAARAADASCGERVAFALDERDAGAWVRLPSGRTVPVKSGVLTDTNEIGLYTLGEEREDGEVKETAFALHIPFDESDTASLAASREGTSTTEPQRKIGREWTVWVLLLAFVILLLEWEASRRGA